MIAHLNCALCIQIFLANKTTQDLKKFIHTNSSVQAHKAKKEKCSWLANKVNKALGFRLMVFESLKWKA